VVVRKESAQLAYKNPPVEEAVVEFQFARSTEWNDGLAGVLHMHPLLTTTYAAKPKERQITQVDIQFGSAQDENFARRSIERRVQLRSEDGARVVTVGSYVLGVSTLKPYDGWGAVRGRVRDVLKAFHEVESDVPPLRRVGVRYINHVYVPLELAEFGAPQQLKRYFNCGPRWEAGCPPIHEFLTRTVRIFENGARLTTTFAPLAKGSHETPGFLLDLDTAQMFSEPLSEPVDGILSLVDRFHEEVRAAFDASLTGEAKEFLDE